MVIGFGGAIIVIAKMIAGKVEVGVGSCFEGFGWCLGENWRVVGVEGKFGGR